jgi:outer membrane protein OmpA-like peptidoglycan-associated protein
MNREKTILGLALIGGLALAAGCAHDPTPHLLAARSAYDDARNGTANKYVPDEVYEAKVALDEAEKAHNRRPGSDIEKHYAYVAQRKAMLAIAKAGAKEAMHERKQAEATGEKVLLSQRNASRGALETTKDALTREKEARAAAERAAANALASLEEIATIRSEDQRVVITLSGEVLFKTNEATLLPMARSRLDRVAEVLKAQGNGKPIVIAGHTDSRGKTAYNDDLSRRRAESVRSYLVGKGVPSDMVQAVGRGENEPIADNGSAEGRANNRRVEIIIGEGEASRTSHVRK